MQIPLEDTFADVLGKAAHGLGFNTMGLSRQTGIDPARIDAVLEGRFDSGIVARLAGALNLHGPSLFELATRAWYPQQVGLKGLEMFNTPFPVRGYEEMTVNNYLVWDPVSRYAVVFDTGANVDQLVELIREKSLKVSMVCLTHRHDDHVRALPALLAATGNPPVYISQYEPLPGATLIEKDMVLSVGYLQLESFLTNGHSPGGTSYLVNGLDRPVAVVGDSLFCCSQGGAPGHYKQALDNNLRQILSLPDWTVVCPGHGPMTTVGEEKEHNPFFAAQFNR